MVDLPAGLGATLMRGGYRELMVSERPPLSAGARIYLSTPTGVESYLDLVRVEPRPSGTRLVCAVVPTQMPNPVDACAATRPAPVSERCHWRWWPREAEDSPRRLAGCRYDVDEHAIGFVWRHRRPTAGPAPRDR